MLNIILLIVIVVIIIALVLNNKKDHFTCKGVTLNNIRRHTPLAHYETNQNQQDIINTITSSINGAFEANKPNCPTISNELNYKDMPPLIDCPSCVCPKVVINTSDLQECKSNCPAVEPCPEKVCPRPEPQVCPNTDCTYLGIKGIENPDELFNVISEMLKNNKCTKQTLISGINNIFENHNEPPKF